MAGSLETLEQMGHDLPLAGQVNCGIPVKKLGKALDLKPPPIGEAVCFIVGLTYPAARSDAARIQKEAVSSLQEPFSPKHRGREAIAILFGHMKAPIAIKVSTEVVLKEIGRQAIRPFVCQRFTRRYTVPNQPPDQSHGADAELAVPVSRVPNVGGADSYRVVALNCDAKSVELVPVGSLQAKGKLTPFHGDTTVRADEAEPVGFGFGVDHIEERRVVVVAAVSIAASDTATLQQVSDSLGVHAKPPRQNRAADTLLVQAKCFVFGIVGQARVQNVYIVAAEYAPGDLAVHTVVLAKNRCGYTCQIASTNLGLLFIRKASPIRACLTAHMVVVDVFHRLAFSDAEFSYRPGGYRCPLAAPAITEAHSDDTTLRPAATALRKNCSSLSRASSDRRSPLVSRCPDRIRRSVQYVSRSRHRSDGTRSRIASWGCRPRLSTDHSHAPLGDVLGSGRGI